MSPGSRARGAALHPAIVTGNMHDLRSEGWRPMTSSETYAQVRDRMWRKEMAWWSRVPALCMLFFGGMWLECALHRGGFLTWLWSGLWTLIGLCLDRLRHRH